MSEEMNLTDAQAAQVKALVAFKDTSVAGNVKAAAKDAGAKSSDLWRVPVDAIKIKEGYNPRIETQSYLSKLTELAKSITANGFYDDKPIGVTVVSEDGRDVFYVEDGHRRRLAVDIAINDFGAPIETLPVVVLPRSMSADERLIHMYKSNNDGEPFTTLETAILAARLASFGYDTSKIAERLGRTVTYVNMLMTLAAAPKDIRDYVADGTLAANTVIETLQVHKGNAVEILQEAVATVNEEQAAEAAKPKRGRKAAETSGKAPWETEEGQAAGKKSSRTARVMRKDVEKAAEKVVKKKGGRMTKAEKLARSEKLQRKHALEAFALLVEMFDKNGAKINKEFHATADELFAKCEML